MVTKNKKLLGTLLIIVIVLSVAFSAFMLAPKNSLLCGMSYFDAPVTSATISLFSLDGTKLYENQNATLDNGAFFLAINWGLLWSIPQEFKVVVSDGIINDEPFNGTLARYIDNYDQKSYYAINPVTTLMAAYKEKNPSLSYETIGQNVSAFLEIPNQVDINDVANRIDRSRVFFDTQKFAVEAQVNGGLNAYVDKLSVEFTQGKTHPFKSELLGGFGDFAGWAGSGIAGGIANGMLSWVGGQAMGWAMGLLGFKSADQQILDKLNEISHKLDVMDAKLDSIISDLSALSQQISELQSALKIVDEDLKNQMRAIGSYDSISTINSAYDMLTLYAKCGPGNVSTTAINEWTSSVLQPTTGVPKALDNLNMFLIGQGDSEPGLMETMERSMANQLYQPGISGVTRYGADFRTKAASLFQGFTDKVQTWLVVELKGLLEIVEAYHARNDTVPAQLYMQTIWQPRIQNQMNLYMTLAEKFAITVERYDRLEFPNLGAIPSSQLAALQSYYQTTYNQPLPAVAQILPSAYYFADQVVNGAGRFTVNVMVAGVISSTNLPTDPQPVFQNMQTGQTYQTAGTLKTVPNLENDGTNYYFTYNFTQVPQGTYKLISPTSLNNGPFTGWYTNSKNAQNEYWSYNDAIKMSMAQFSGGQGYIEVNNDENGHPYGYWGGVWMVMH